MSRERKLLLLLLMGWPSPPSEALLIGLGTLRPQNQGKQPLPGWKLHLLPASEARSTLPLLSQGQVQMLLRCHGRKIGPPPLGLQGLTLAQSLL